MDENKKKTASEFNEELRHKVRNELGNYRTQLLSMSSEEMLDHAYQYAIMAEIADYIEHRDIAGDQAEQLLKAENSLDAIYVKWGTFDVLLLKTFREAIACKANEICREEIAKELRARKARERDER